MAVGGVLRMHVAVNVRVDAVRFPLLLNMHHIQIQALPKSRRHTHPHPQSRTIKSLRIGFTLSCPFSDPISVSLFSLNTPHILFGSTALNFHPACSSAFLFLRALRLLDAIPARLARRRWWRSDTIRSIHLFLEARVAHAGGVAVGDFGIEDRVVGDIVPVYLSAQRH